MVSYRKEIGMIRLRTGYSFRAAYGPIKDVLAQLSGPYAPITDRASSYGWVRWDKAARDAGFIPVYGVELAVTPVVAAKRPLFDYWVFYSLTGSLQPINNLISLAYENFRYQPLVPVWDALRLPDLAKVVGRRTPKRWLEAGRMAGEGYYAAGPGITLPRAHAYAECALEPILACDNHWPDENGIAPYEIISGRNSERQTWPQGVMSKVEIERYLKEQGWPKSIIKKAGSNADQLLKTASKAQLRKATLPTPNITEHGLRELCNIGIAKKYQVKGSWTKGHKARLAKELDLIERKGYENYFLIVADICIWARRRMLVGPARGSSCGSLVCYLLDITTIDPIPYGLIFERFVDINRDDMPDIDIDFPEHRRNEVIEYMRQSYGSEHVSKLGTVAIYRPRSALKETSSAIGVPKGFIEPVLNSIIERSSGDARALDTLEDTLQTMEPGKALLEAHPEMRVATALEGHPRHSSSHASAIVLTSTNIDEHAPFNPRDSVMMLDKKDAEELNILKVDVLGLTQLSILEYAMELAGEDVRDLYHIPLGDKQAFQLLRDKRYYGVFQFNGQTMLACAKRTDILDLNDIAIMIAISRPGPMASGNADKWIEYRKKNTKVNMPEMLRPMLDHTYGIPIYQEQVMEIGRQIGGLSWGDVTALRKAMSKSLGREYFDQFGDPWKRGAIAKGMDKDYADKLWDDLCVYGSFGFNKSHCIAYGMISYWCAYVKSRWPVQFAAATLSYEHDIERQRIILREIVEDGIEYLPFDAEISDNLWKVDGNRVIGPLSNIRGIGPKMTKTILGARARKEPLSDALRKRLECGTTDLDSLYPVQDAYARLVPEPLARNIITEPTRLREIEDGMTEGTVLVIAVPVKINPRDANEEINVVKRGHRIENGPTNYLVLRLRDDTGEMIGIVPRYSYDRIGHNIVQRGGANKVLYALKGEVTELGTSKLIMVDAVKYLGMMT